MSFAKNERYCASAGISSTYYPLNLRHWEPYSAYMVPLAPVSEYLNNYSKVQVLEDFGFCVPVCLAIPLSFSP